MTGLAMSRPASITITEDLDEGLVIFNVHAMNQYIGYIYESQGRWIWRPLHKGRIDLASMPDIVDKLRELNGDQTR
jgi:hypothetical protein